MKLIISKPEEIKIKEASVFVRPLSVLHHVEFMDMIRAVKKDSDYIDICKFVFDNAVLKTVGILDENGIDVQPKKAEDGTTSIEYCQSLPRWFVDVFLSEMITCGNIRGIEEKKS